MPTEGSASARRCAGLRTTHAVRLAEESEADALGTERYDGCVKADTAGGSMRPRNTGIRFKQVDVFTNVPFKGNPVAVVLDGDALTTPQMQSIASWTNLSETTFVCSPAHPEADYRLRIFTPRAELPFAGHPTIGSAWAVLQRGLAPRAPGVLVQECTKGLVTVRVDGDRLYFSLPKPSFTEMSAEDLIAVSNALGIPRTWIGVSAVVDVGAVWMTVQLPSSREVIELEPDMQAVAAIAAGTTGITVFGFYPADNPSAVEVRSFAPADGVPEDPVCGSGNGCVAAMIERHGLLDTSRYVASQGQRLGRDGRVEIEFAEDETWVGGAAVTCVDGSLFV
jgi:PhzF family phenazine biosynthesis protein